MTSMRLALVAAVIAVAGLGVARADDAPRQARAAIEKVIDAAQRAGADERGRAALRGGIDIDAIAELILGQKWVGAAARDKDLFREALFASLAYDVSRRIGRQSAELKVEGWRKLSNGDGLAATRILLEGQRPRSVDWRLRGNATPRVIDITVDGYSMVAAAREEFVGWLNQNGGSLGELAGLLRSRIPQGSF